MYYILTWLNWLPSRKMFTPNLSPPSILGFALLAGLFVLSAKRVFGHLAGEKQNYPPGPKGVPIFGMLFRFFTATWSDFDQWGKKYGQHVACLTVGALLM